MTENETYDKRPINHNFKLMTAHTALARTGTSAFAISIIWIALELTKSPEISGFADGMFSLPLFLSFGFGAYIDRLRSKRALAVLSSASRVVVVLMIILAVIFTSFWLRVLTLYSVTFILGMTSDILNSIRGTWTKQFLLESQYKTGMSLLESVSTVAQGAGFLISAAILTLGIIPATYGISLIFLTSVIPIVGIRDRKEISELEEHESIGSSMKEGLAYIAKSGLLKAAIIITLFLNLAFGVVGIFFAFLVNNMFNLPALYYGLLFFSLTMGIVIGSVVASKVRGKLGLLNAIFVSTLGVLMASMSLFTSIYPDFAVTFAMGLLIGIVNVISQTGILSTVKHEMMGRVSGAFSTFGLGVTFLSGGIGGLLIAYFTLHWAFVIIGVIVASVAILSTGFKEYYNLRV